MIHTPITNLYISFSFRINLKTQRNVENIQVSYIKCHIYLSSTFYKNSKTPFHQFTISNRLNVQIKFEYLSLPHLERIRYNPNLYWTLT